MLCRRQISLVFSRLLPIARLYASRALCKRPRHPISGFTFLLARAEHHLVAPYRMVVLRFAGFEYNSFKACRIRCPILADVGRTAACALSNQE